MYNNHGNGNDHGKKVRTPRHEGAGICPPDGNYYVNLWRKPEQEVDELTGLPLKQDSK